MTVKINCGCNASPYIYEHKITSMYWFRSVFLAVWYAIELRFQLNKPASPLYSSLMKLHKKPQYRCLYCEYVCVIKCVLLFLLWRAMENGFSGVIAAFAESTLFSSARRNLAMMHGKSIAVSKHWIWFSAQHAPKRFHLCLGKHIEIKHAEWICLEPKGVNIGQKKKNE